MSPFASLGTVRAQTRLSPVAVNPMLSASPLPPPYLAFDRLRDERFAPTLQRGMAEPLAPAAVAAARQEATARQALIDHEEAERRDTVLATTSCGTTLRFPSCSSGARSSPPIGAAA
jgi:hypothetical protein